MDRKRLIFSALLGMAILGLFAAAFTWLYVGVAGKGAGKVFLKLAPWWVYPYLVVVSAYVCFFTAGFAKGRTRRPWLWAVAGFVLAFLFILGLPGLLSPLFPKQNAEIFAGPAIVAFLAPILSTLLLMLVINLRSKKNHVESDHPNNTVS